MNNEQHTDSASKKLNKTIRAATSWTDFSYLRWSGVDKPTSRLGKIKVEKFLQENNFPHLKVLKVFNSARDINLDNTPDCFVLKPSSLWSGKGVMLLHKIANIKEYYDSKSGKVVSASRIKELGLQLENEIGKKISFIIEERALDEDSNVNIPFDYKVFTFYGVPKFILQVDRNHPTPKMAFFDGEFNPITDDRVIVSESKKSDAEGMHRTPQCAEDILKLASDITLKLNASFISVDCYATTKGAMFGELTHTPGGPWYGSMYRFSETFDKELGAAWAEAYRQLGQSIPNIATPYEIKFKGNTVRTIY